MLSFVENLLCLDYLTKTHDGSQRYQRITPSLNSMDTLLQKQGQNGRCRPAQTLPLFAGEGRGLGKDA